LKPVRLANGSRAYDVERASATTQNQVEELTKPKRRSSPMLPVTLIELMRAITRD
jgi:hypothetical protein